MPFLLGFKLLIVLLFLIQFLRRPGWVWGIGLLSVTTAVLLDTMLGTLGREQTVAELGFYFYLLSGTLVGGMALWVWGLLRPHLDETAVAATLPEPAATPTANGGPLAADDQRMFHTLKERLSMDDLLDLIFDLDMDELEMIVPYAPAAYTLHNVMAAVSKTQQEEAFQLAITRIESPPPATHLPRRDKITAASPRTIIRHYLLAHYSSEQLQQIATQLDVDWQQLSMNNKRSLVRSLLHSLYHDNRINTLLDTLPADTVLP